MKLAYSFLLLISLSSQGAGAGQEQRGSANDVALTILYDNTSVSDSIIADHGFSCLVESGGRSLLFDAGRSADKFMANVGRLAVNLSRIGHVVISHIHDDHMGGLVEILARCSKPELVLPFSYPQFKNEPLGDRAERDFQALLERFRPLVSGIVRKKESVQIGGRYFTTGMIENDTYENSLIVPTPRGLIIITGCAHLGILEIVKRAKELMKQDVYFVLGGFHLAAAEPERVQAIAGELRKLTKRIGPCHCTGEAAREKFKDVFQEDYVDIRAGLRLKIHAEEKSK